MMRDILKLGVRYGLIGSGLIIIMFLVFYFSEENPLLELQMFDLFIIPVFIFFGVKEFRDRYNGHFLKYWHGMTVGSFIFILIAVSTTLFIMAFIEWGNKELVDSYVNSQLEVLEETRTKIVEEMGAASYLESYESVKKTSASVILWDNFLKKIIIGFLITTVVAVVLKKLPKEEKN